MFMSVLSECFKMCDYCLLIQRYVYHFHLYNYCLIIHYGNLHDTPGHVFNEMMLSFLPVFFLFFLRISGLWYQFMTSLFH